MPKKITLKREYYICRYLLDGNDRYLIWYTNDVDGVWLDNGKIPVFHKQNLLLEYASNHHIGIEPEEPCLHDLDKVSRWLNHPNISSVDCKGFSAAWNLFTDVSSSVRGNFDPDKRKTDKVYQKIFWALNLPSMTPKEKQYEPKWTKKEVEIMREVLTQGLELFRKSTENYP